jgi:hypothetical protein
MTTKPVGLAASGSTPEYQREQASRRSTILRPPSWRGNSASRPPLSSPEAPRHPRCLDGGRRDDR